MHFHRIFAWYVADRMRETRNQFAHGRWGLQMPTQKVVNVSDFPPDHQTERRCSLCPLDSIVDDIDLINKEQG